MDAEPAAPPVELCYCGTPVSDDPLGLCRRCRVLVDGGVSALRSASDTVLGLLVISVLEANLWHKRDTKKTQRKHKRCVSCLPARIIDAAVDIYEFVRELKRETVPPDTREN